MRKWTKSACVVIALGILALLAVVGSRETSHTAQATLSIASSTQAIPADDTAALITAAAPLTTAPSALMTAAAPLATAPSATWTVRPGDTLSAIAAAFAVKGGWQALYAANRAAVGPDPSLLQTGVTLTLPGTAKPLKYAVAPGDTLTGIAVAMSVAGGWRALYAANRRAIGSNPGLIRPGTILVAPSPAVSSQPRTPAPASQPPGPAAPRQTPGSAAPSQSPAPAAPASAAPASAAPASAAPASGNAHATPPLAGRTGPVKSPRPGSAGGMPVVTAMPRWLKGTLLAAALLTVIAFTVESALMISRRRSARTARPPATGGPGDRAAGYATDLGAAEALRRARVVQADYDRLIVTYSVSDHTVYLLTPPGEDPRTVLRAARLVLPEDTYEELAGHLGVPSGWRE